MAKAVPYMNNIFNRKVQKVFRIDRKAKIFFFIATFAISLRSLWLNLFFKMKVLNHFWNMNALIPKIKDSIFYYISTT